MYAKRKTINANVSISGIGLHSGIYTRINLQPAVAGSGITFVRDDLDGLRIACAARHGFDAGGLARGESRAGPKGAENEHQRGKNDASPVGSAYCGHGGRPF